MRQSFTPAAPQFNYDVFAASQICPAARCESTGVASAFNRTGSRLPIYPRGHAWQAGCTGALAVMLIWPFPCTVAFAFAAAFSFGGFSTAFSSAFSSEETGSLPVTPCCFGSCCCCCLLNGTVASPASYWPQTGALRCLQLSEQVAMLFPRNLSLESSGSLPAPAPRCLTACLLPAAAALCKNCCTPALCTAART